MQRPIAILYEDAQLLAIDKPAGLLSAPGRGEHNRDCAAARIQRTHPTATIVHRLDMATSGVMLMALDAATHRALGLAFESRRVEKTYVALVHGCVAEDTGEITAPLAKDFSQSLPPRHQVDLE
ncbi:MAG: hypothetical protein KDA41_13705, partial [Planctomycetales bacterium]|nr:hypothetical protein [Planctomycetales bacterium]